ncbi:hypothetical protein BDV95DRAFT_393880 [Massariosphaeria phaeospora]|uniref:Uncharacterized protein n=1 Tax=Massariosphaeria phaeospora TaxID=100035 RepID=A0A7C8I7L3_9PLEO|nr:hypothetical protein BDV95DRAFT_393880 [Massariosphaeria phaeospora]
MRKYTMIRREVALAHLGERQTEVSLRLTSLCGIWRYCVRSTEATFFLGKIEDLEDGDGGKGWLGIDIRNRPKRRPRLTHSLKSPHRRCRRQLVESTTLLKYADSHFLLCCI